MLALNLSKIRTAHEQFERVYEPADLELRDDEVAAPVALAFDIFKDKQQFRLAGTVKTTLTLDCSRCLEPFAWPVDAAFDLRYQPLTPQANEGERELGDDDMTAAFYEHDEIDLGQLMIEQIYLGLPMKPLCAGDCKGLCALCGINLNRGTCTCETHWEDPRLAALKSLKRES